MYNQKNRGLVLVSTTKKTYTNVWHLLPLKSMQNASEWTKVTHVNLRECASEHCKHEAHVWVQACEWLNTQGWVANATPSQPTPHHVHHREQTQHQTHCTPQPVMMHAQCVSIFGKSHSFGLFSQFWVYYQYSFVLLYVFEYMFDDSLFDVTVSYFFLWSHFFVLLVFVFCLWCNFIFSCDLIFFLAWLDYSYV